MVPTRLRNYNPMKIFDGIFNEFFEDFDLKFPTDYLSSEFFHSDVLRGDDNTIYVDVPGFNKENLSVEFNNGLIEISGENETGRKISKKIKIGNNLSELVNAEVKDGVLKLEFEENKENEKRQIEIN